MKIALAYENNNLVEKHEIDFSNGLSIINYKNKLFFDAIVFDEPAKNIKQIVIDDIVVFPKDETQSSFLTYDLISSYFSFTILMKIDFAKNKEFKDFSNKLRERNDEFKKIEVTNEREKIKKLQEVLSYFVSFENTICFTFNLNESLNDLSVIQKATKSLPIPIIILDKKQKVEISETPIVVPKKSEKPIIKETNEIKIIDNGLEKSEKGRTKIDWKEQFFNAFKNCFSPFWGNFLFMFLHSVLIVSFFLLGIPLLNQPKFFAIGVLFVVIGSICFILAFTIVIDFSAEIIKVSNKKNTIIIKFFEFIALLFGIGIGSLLFFSLALNNILIKIADFNIVSIYILSALFAVIVLLVIFCKVGYLMHSCVSKITKKFLKK